MWTPITIEELTAKIEKAVPGLDAEVLRFWEQIKIEPKKWQEDGYGDEGGGFWVVAVFGRNVIWYNDIEEGFNVSAYSIYGKIDEYWCNQDELNRVLVRLADYIKNGKAFSRLGSPEPLR